MTIPDYNRVFEFPGFLRMERIRPNRRRVGLKLDDETIWFEADTWPAAFALAAQAIDHSSPRPPQVSPG